MKAKPVILSGGSGVRLWPISRKNLAKQFVDIFQNESSLFLEKPKSWAPGTKMSYKGISKQTDLINVLKYLANITKLNES